MRRLFLAGVLILILGAFDAQAANWYVRPSGGSGSGTSWTAAWNGLNGINWGSVSAGDTIWVAGGTYNNGLSTGKSGNSNNYITIARARSDSSACTGASGWSSSYASTVDMYRCTIEFGSYNYIKVSGKTSSSPAAFGDYGWLIEFPGVSTGKGIEWPNGSSGSYIVVEYLEIRGPNTSGTAYHFSDDGRGVDDTSFASATDHTFSHCKIWGWESGLYVVSTNNHISEYCDIYYIASDGTMHPNIYYILGAANGIIRYCKIHDSWASGTGIAFSDDGPWNNWHIYGNVFYDMISGSAGLGYAFGVQGAAIVGLKLWNNTFVNISNLINNDTGYGSGCEMRNNLFYNASYRTFGTASNNLNATSSGVFNGYSSKDFSIVSSTGSGYPRNAGTNLSSYFTNDVVGTTFGADGTWDIGAYEYRAGTSQGAYSSPPPQVSAPNAPGNLSVVQ